MGSIDRMDWHAGGDFPKGLPEENGATHIGMYLAWIINKGLYGDIHKEAPEDLNMINKVLNREITGREFLLEQCDTKFTNEDLNEESEKFTDYYYSDEVTNEYFEDYAETLAEHVETVYHVEDTWENYDKLAPVIDEQFATWKKERGAQ